LKSALDISQITPPLRNENKQIQAKKGRNKLYRLRDEAAEILGGRQSKCGKCAIFTGGSANISIQAKNKESYFFSGLETCGNVWTCPVCALKITYNRAANVANILHNIQKTKLFSIGFLTLTIRHTYKDSLKQVKNDILQAYRKFTKSRKYLKLCQIYDIKGNIRSLEIKFSKKTGWHPHLHILYVSTQKPIRLEIFAETFILYFLKEMKEKSQIQGQKYIPVYDFKGIETYLTKWKAADEICKGHTKEKSGGESFTPFEMLNFITENKHKPEKQAEVMIFKRKFKEYATETKGARQISISTDIKQYSTDIDFNKTDEEIANEKQNETEIILKMDIQVFKQINKYGLQAEVINILQYESKENLIYFLEEFGIFTFLDHNELKLLKNENFEKIETPNKYLFNYKNSKILN